MAEGNRRGPIMGSLTSLCTCRTSYWSSIETTALSCLVFWRQTDKRTDGHHRLVRTAPTSTNKSSKTVASVEKCCRPTSSLGVHLPKHVGIS